MKGFGYPVGHREDTIPKKRVYTSLGAWLSSCKKVCTFFECCQGFCSGLCLCRTSPGPLSRPPRPCAPDSPGPVTLIPCWSQLACPHRPLPACPNAEARSKGLSFCSSESHSQWKTQEQCKEGGDPSAPPSHLCHLWGTPRADTTVMSTL